MISKPVPLISETSAWSYMGRCCPSAGVLGRVGLLSFMPILLKLFLLKTKCMNY